MDNRALYRLSYSVFVLTTKTADKENGCIANTCIQVASSPTRVVVSVQNTSYTCGLIKESGVFAVSLLDETATFDTIKHWGLQSGRNVDKLAGLTLPKDVNGVPYVTVQTCSILSCKVVESHDLGSHTLFVAEVVDAKVLNDNDPLTYADYRNKVKPKPQAKSEEKKIIGWRCTICGYVHDGAELPDDFICPWCGHPREDFEPIYDS